MGSARKGRVRSNHPAPAVAADKLARNLRLALTAATGLANNKWLNCWPEVQISMSEVRVRLQQCQEVLAACDKYVRAGTTKAVTDH